jgi:hypothetical protein
LPRRALGLFGLLALMGCAPIDADPPLAVSRELSDGPVRRFSFRALDGRVVSSQGYRGRMTVVAMVATYDTASQAQAKFLETVVRRHTPRINALLLVLEPPEHQPLVEAYASSLGLSYDVAIADAATIAGKGAFPGLHHVPSIVLLDRAGREVWRNFGLVEADNLSEAIADYDDQAR